MAHGSDLGTTHTDGKFELLYCHLRHLKMSEKAAYSRAVAMLAEARKIKKQHAPVQFAVTHKKGPNVGQFITAGFKYAFVKI